MFAHIFKYRLKRILNNKSTLFWTMLFPLLLASFFHLAFSNLLTGEKFQPVNVAVVDNTAWQENENFRNVLNEVSSGDGRLFNLTETSAEKADKLLMDNSISGYIVVDEQIRMVVSKAGMRQSIIKSFIDNYMQNYSAFERILSNDPSKFKQLIESSMDRRSFTNETGFPGGEPDYTVNYFYSLIAMACFYGGFMGMQEINDIQANISSVAARVNNAPVHKMKAFLSSAAASLLVQFSEILILLFYITVVLKVDFGSRTAYVFLTAFLGSVSGLAFGTFISALVKKSEGVKVGILVSVTMFCSFLAGMMQQSIKYSISRNAPVISWINPLNLLTDAFYCLYYLDSMSRYILNMAATLAFILLFCSVTYFIIRRRKYASL